MGSFLANIKGDLTLWVIVVLLALFSMMSVYSASSNIAFSYGGGNTFNMLAKHAIHLILGIILMYAVHNMDYRHLGAISVMLVPVSLLLLIYTLTQGYSVANASRWIHIPFIGWTFQPSAFANVVLMVYLSRYLAKTEYEKLRSFRQSFIPLLVPIFLVCGLILPANFSTAALIFTISMLLLFIGGYPINNLLYMLGMGIVAFGIFILLAIAFPNVSNRVETWKNRIENFNRGNKEENYQVEKAKMAIAEGQLIGKGPGKSIQKNFLPQSNSDFIYVIIVEEFGLIGGLVVIFFYVMLLVRILLIATRASTRFGILAVAGLGLSIMTQAFVNLGVAVNLLPVTGQALPLISAGGSNIWMTYIAVGIILSISRDKPEEREDDLESKDLARG